MMKNNKGFTLVELLAVIVVLAVIALIGYSVIGDVIENAEISANKTTVMNYAKALEQAKYTYLAANGIEPTEDWIKSNAKVSNDNFECDSIDYQDDKIEIMGCKFDDDNDNRYCYIDGKSYVNGECYEGNLVKNGDLEFKDNTNFSQFTYDSVNKELWYKSSEKQVSLCSNEKIPVDTNKKYELSVEAKTDNLDAVFYGGIRQYDIDYKEIKSSYYMYYNGENTLSELAETLIKGESNVIKLKPPRDDYTVSELTAWYNAWKTESEKTYENGFIFWNYKDSTGYQYPAKTYSRNVYTNRFLTGKVEWNESDKILEIKLGNSDEQKVWPFDTIPGGTMLSRSDDGQTYNYGWISTSDSKRLTSEYTKRTFYITGVITNGNIDNNVNFRPGTKYISPCFSYNYDGDSTTVNGETVYPTLYIKNISIREVE